MTPRNAPATPERDVAVPASAATAMPRASATRVAQRAAWWLACLPEDRMLDLDDDTRLRRGALGWLVGAWAAFMCIVWAKVGWRYFGLPGALACLLVPALVLALDRVLISATRNPGGELSGHAVAELAAVRRHALPRMLMAISFSAVSTLTFMLDLSHDEIAARHARDQQRANAPIREELVAAREAEHAARLAALSAQRAMLEEQQRRLSADLAAARETTASAESGAQAARRHALAEEGGLGGRRQGAGPRYQAYEDLSRAEAATAAAARAREIEASSRVANVGRDLAQLDEARLAAVRSHHAALEAVDDAARRDPRYVQRLSGVFADTTVFIRLLSDPDDGTGRVLWFVVLAGFLFCLELAPLLGFHFLPITPFDVDRIARSRVEAARVVAQSEIDIARLRSRVPPFIRQAGDAAGLAEPQP